MRMVILSDNIKPQQKTENVDILTWDDVTKSVFDYDIIVLDMKMEDDEIRTETQERISSDVGRGLYNGLIVIYLLHQTISFTAEDTDDFIEDTYPCLYGFESFIRFYNANGESFTNPSEVVFKKYFEGVKEYNALIEEIEYDGFYYIWCGKGGYRKKGKVIPISFLNTISDIISCVVEYPNNGKLIFLPQSTKPPEEIIKDLFDIGKYYIKEEIEIKPPEWISNYIPKEEKQLESDLGKLRKDFEQEEIKIKKELRKFKNVDILLFGKDKQLENAVKTVFEDFGLKVKKTEQGYTVDLIGDDNAKNRKFVFEITGTDGKINKKSNKITQIFEYHKDKKDEEKLILVANTHCDKDLKLREKEEHYTEDAIKLLSSMEVCILPSVKLYSLWQDLREKKIDSEEILDKIYTTIGVFE